MSENEEGEINLSDLFKAFFETYEPGLPSDEDCEHLSTQEIFEMINSHSPGFIDPGDVYLMMKKTGFYEHLDPDLNEIKWILRPVLRES